jgi:hypothetical protein
LDGEVCYSHGQIPERTVKTTVCSARACSSRNIGAWAFGL